MALPSIQLCKLGIGSRLAPPSAPAHPSPSTSSLAPKYTHCSPCAPPAPLWSKLAPPLPGLLRVSHLYPCHPRLLPILILQLQWPFKRQHLSRPPPASQNPSVLLPELSPQNACMWPTRKALQSWLASLLPCRSSLGTVNSSCSRHRRAGPLHRLFPASLLHPVKASPFFT